ncbi:MAG: hypothetical protein KDI07_14905 [Anaerolineae bacterium]|nr:hypothetical protein [Anaerolineae bacterium]MCB0249862.1 hypothetical protein [Anaerolineae bacterium]MCB9129518.1 hypothetical protein [Anaerolineales bacterium]MCO5242594.1 hypothetical protein [Anaerolineae bacterium]
MDSEQPSTAARRPGWDALLLAVLVIARLRINSFAEATLFEHFQNVTTHSLLGRLLTDRAEAAFGPWFGDPIALLLAALSIGALIVYLVVDLMGTKDWGPGTEEGRWRGWVKAGLVWAIIAFTVLLPTVKITLLRHENLPQSYSHDGGVIQTEATIDYFLSGKNPYVEDYRNTPMAEWGLEEFRTALDHYPYLPWTFVASAPVKLLSDALLGWYDQRFVYLIAFVLGLILATRLVARERTRWRLGLLMLLGLNPIMGLDLIFGQNDLFVWFWIVLAFWLLARSRSSVPGAQSPHPTPNSPFPILLASAAFGLACASKPTAWFLAPFFALLLVRDQLGSWRDIVRSIPLMLKRGWPALAVFAVLIVPYLVWDANAFIDDVWRWAAGTAATHYQIWGWGASNFVLAFGGLTSRFDYWPFWIPELIVTLPLLIWLGWRQTRGNTIGAASWHYGLLLLAFLFVSRFLNENYLGYILAFLAMGYFVVESNEV